MTTKKTKISVGKAIALVVAFMFMCLYTSFMALYGLDASAKKELQDTQAECRQEVNAARGSVTFVDNSSIYVLEYINTKNMAVVTVAAGKTEKVGGHQFVFIPTNCLVSRNNPTANVFVTYSSNDGIGQIMACKWYSSLEEAMATLPSEWL